MMVAAAGPAMKLAQSMTRRPSNRPFSTLFVLPYAHSGRSCSFTPQNGALARTSRYVRGLTELADFTNAAFTRPQRSRPYSQGNASRRENHQMQSQRRISPGRRKSLLADYSANLGELVSRRKAEAALRSAKVESDMASRTKSDFLANMSH